MNYRAAARQLAAVSRSGHLHDDAIPPVALFNPETGMPSHVSEKSADFPRRVRSSFAEWHFGR
jgi:hypothetical protein